jgi:hypothetical protein
MLIHYGCSNETRLGIMNERVEAVRIDQLGIETHTVGVFS